MCASRISIRRVLQPGAADDILRTLEAPGLEWDGEVIRQSDRQAHYEDALAAGRYRGVIRPMHCSQR
ncbi:MAG: glutamyl-Q tRNA(Asp) synthetase [Gammaproteobacteria bacterium]|nr:MAG: glutamyl-Q tRNA(Asp) synthetase [Gammaproteobacteria bacterium]